MRIGASFATNRNPCYGLVPGELLLAHPLKPSSENWDFEDEQQCQEKLPQLWAKFGEG